MDMDALLPHDFSKESPPAPGDYLVSAIILLDDKPEAHDYCWDTYRAQWTGRDWNTSVDQVVHIWYSAEPVENFETKYFTDKSKLMFKFARWVAANYDYEDREDVLWRSKDDRNLYTDNSLREQFFKSIKSEHENEKRLSKLGDISGD